MYIWVFGVWCVVFGVGRRSICSYFVSTVEPLFIGDVVIAKPYQTFLYGLRLPAILSHESLYWNRENNASVITVLLLVTRKSRGSNSGDPAAKNVKLIIVLHKNISMFT